MNACPTSDNLARYRGGTLTNAADIRAFEDHLRQCSSCRESLRRQTAYAAVPLAARLMPQPDQSLHLTDAEMLAYARGLLEDVELEVVHSHLELCEQCRADVAELQAFERQMRDDKFSHIDERLAHPSLRERCESAFSTLIHAFGVGSLRNALNWWNQRTLNSRLGLGLVLGILAGLLMQGRASALSDVQNVFLALLQALATPFIFVAIVHTLMDADVTGRMARRLAYLALSNTLVAVCIGLFVGAVAKPGVNSGFNIPTYALQRDALGSLTAQVPRTLFQPLLDNHILFTVLIAVAFGVSLRLVRQEQIKERHKDYQVIGSVLSSVYRSLTIMLNWVVALVPFAVFAAAAELVGTRHWRDFQSLFNFFAAVLFALFLQISFYLIRLWFRAAMPPQKFLRGAWAAVLTAFSTASSAATIPITYTSVRDRVGVRERSAGLGVLVGAHFNRDGTALYEAITPIFIAQALGRHLDFTQQIIIVLMAIVASIAAPGVPQAGLVTMVLVLKAVDLPIWCIGWLLPLDWLLDRFRTAVNVLGGMTVTCLLDRRSIPYPSSEHPEHPEHAEALEPEVVN